jgi:anti-sigma regulatory factor (Ser/Thr protein kinase)
MLGRWALRVRRVHARARPFRQSPAGLLQRARAVEEDLSVRLGGGKDAPARARRALSRLRGDVDAPTLETLRLLVSEIVANSVRHARSDGVSLRVLVQPGTVLTEVSDDGDGFEPDADRGPRPDHTGWGLFLVERLADRWGVVRDGDSTRVWFELRRATVGSRPA